MITPLTAVQFVVLLKAVLQVPAVHPAPTTQLRFQLVMVVAQPGRHRLSEMRLVTGAARRSR